jgi:hypothetical protein
MTTYIYRAGAIALLGLSCSVYAETSTNLVDQHCSDSTVRLVGKHFAISDFGGVIVAGVCKVWPKDKSLTIAMFAYESDEDYRKELVVAMVNSAKGSVVASYKGFIGEDAAMRVSETSLRIDTARYDIAPGVRAFGLDVTSGYSSGCGDGGLGAIRTLYVREGSTIRPILENFITHTWRIVQGGPTCAPDGKELVTEDIFYGIGIGKSVTNGYANLVITPAISFSNGVASARKPFQYEIRYDGKEYPTLNSNGGGEALDKWRSQ